MPLGEVLPEPSPPLMVCSLPGTHGPGKPRSLGEELVSKLWKMRWGSSCFLLRSFNHEPLLTGQVLEAASSSAELGQDGP